MASIPTPRSWNQIVGAMVAAFLSRFGLKSLKIGSPVLSIIEAAAQSDLRSSQDIFDLLNAQALDRAEGLALDRIAADEDKVRETESPATGTVVITDSSFKKISSKIYQGQAAPIVGSDTIYVTDASSFPAAGRVFLGRGTTNYEGPLAYTSKVNNGTYWTLSLTDNTRRFHNLGESVIVGQGGNRTIDAGAAVQTPQGNTTDAVKFDTLFASTIPDGEVQISGVQVQAEVPGVGSNVAAGAISTFVSPPFPGAGVTNLLPFTNGIAAEDDQTLRERIKNVRQSRAKGTPLAITTNVQGITATDENKRLTSASVIVRQGAPTTLYIDDGTGYEEVAAGVAIETLIEDASGGEQYFQVAAARPVAKAFILTANVAPFVLSGGAVLTVVVGGETYEHTFDPTAFRSVANASAYEVSSSINSNPALGFSAATAGSGTQVRIFAKGDTNETIEVIAPTGGIDANAALLFPVGPVDTMRLYRNDQLLSKDGQFAVLESKPPSVWGTMTTGVTLIMAVDGTPAQTYTFVDQDFIDSGSGFTTVGRNSLAAWATVLNFKVPGITAVQANGVLEITSNLNASARAKIVISGGTLVSPGQMFAASTSSGTDSDYTLDRNTGQIRLETPLSAGDTLSVGTLNTRAFAESDVLTTQAIGSGGANAWFAVDGSALIVPTGLSSASVLTTSISRVTYWGNRVRVAASAGTFTNVRPGDWLVAFDPNMHAGLEGTWRVSQATSSYVEIERQAMLAGRRNFTATVLNDGRVLVAGGEVLNGALTGTTTQSCEIFDPSTNTWAATGSLTDARRYHAAILIASSGKVLVVGGQNMAAPNSSNALLDAQYLRTAEIWDPATGQWTAAASLPAGQQRRQMFYGLMTAPSELPTIAGGNQTVNNVVTQLNTTYQYNAGSNTWTAKQNMLTGRSQGVSSPILSNTKLLAAGGQSSSGTQSVATTETYDSNLNTWSAGPDMGTKRRLAVGVLQANGSVMVCGGLGDGSTAALNSAETYAVGGGGSWTNTTGNMTVSRVFHAATLMGNQQILIGFGSDGTTGIRLSAETYNPSTGLFTATSAVQSVYDRVNGAMVTVTGGNGLMMGGSENASSERYDSGTGLWTAPDEGVSQASWSLGGNGLVFVRTAANLQAVTIPTGAAFTARNFATSIDSQLVGASAVTFRTNTLRIDTQTYALGGDIALVATDAEGQKLGIDAGSAVENLSTHLAAVASGNTQAGTPEFTLPYVYFGESGTKLRAYNVSQSVKAQSLIVGLRSYDDLYNSATPLYRYGNNVGFVSPLRGVSSYFTKEQYLETRVPGREWISRDRFYAASSFSIGPTDDVTLVIDQDTDTKRFTVPLHRTLKTVGNTYGVQNTFKDADNGGASLATAFGLGYDFNDFAVYMSARVKTFSSDSTKTILWRYTRPGPDGNNARIKFVYPTAPNQALQVLESATSSKFTDVSITLPSGALKSGYALRNATKVGTDAQTDPSGLTIVSYLLGYPVSSATRTQRLNFQGQTVNFTPTEVITGALSGNTATVVSVPVDLGTTGTIIITGATGPFNVNEALSGTSGGAANSNGTQYYQVDLTLTLPTTGGGAMATITDHGFNTSDTLFLNSINANFPGGLKTLTAKTLTTVSFIDGNTTETTAANIGTVSFDPSGEAAWTGASPPVAVGDLLRADASSNLPAAFEATTMRINYLTAQWIQGYFETYSGSTGTVPTWTQIASAASLSIFGLNSGQGTANAIATTVQGYAAAEDSTTPVTAVATGAGTGIVDKASFDESVAPNAWLQFSDGVNYVQTTTSPINLAGDYQLTFKNSIGSDLVSNADWTDEVCYLVPLTVLNLVTWMNTLTVTGLSTVASIEASDRAQRLQIASLTAGSEGAVQIQGGSANEGGASISGSAAIVTDPDISTYAVVTVKKADALGFYAGMWMQVANTTPMPKAVILATTTLNSLNTAGVMVFDNTTSSPLWSYTNSGPLLSITWQVEKQGRYVCYSFDAMNPGAPAAPSLTGVKEGDWVRIVTAVTPTSNAVAVQSVNTGIYRVVRIEDGTNNIKGRAFWIENPNVVEERSEMDVSFYSYDSIMPGDSLSISTLLWGAANQGTWTVESVGAIAGTGPQFVNSAPGQNTLKLVVSSRIPTTVGSVGALGTTEFRLVQVAEAQPGKLIKRIRSISPNQADGAFVDVKFETSPGYKLVNSTAGSILSPLDKLAFPADLTTGVDGYSHNTGLIAEANRVSYGDPRDPATYPGVVAAGAKLNISGPLVKRISVAVNLRLRSGISTTDVAARVKSAIASVINQTDIGQSIAISDLVTAAGKVNGVTAVSMVSPVYTSEDDLISVQPNEKPLVLNLDTDILVSFAGT